MSYVVKLHFTAADKEYAVLRDGFKLGDLVGAKGKHATQTCALKIYSYEASMMFLQEAAPLIKGELCERSGGSDTVVFRGVIRPYQSVSAQNKSEDPFTFELMDYSELMETSYFSTSEEFINKTLAWAVEYVYDKFNLPVSLSYPVAMQNIDFAYLKLDPDEFDTYKELFEQLLFEFGYDYKFTGSNCVINATTIESSTGLQVASIKNQLKIMRDDNWTDGIRIKYGVAEMRRQVYLGGYSDDCREVAWWQYPLAYTYNDHAGTKTRTIAWNFFGGDYSWFNPYRAQVPDGFKKEYVLYVHNVKVLNTSDCTVHSITPHAQSGTINYSYSTRCSYVFGAQVSGGYSFSLTGDIIFALPGTFEEKVSGEKPGEINCKFVKALDYAQELARREYKRAKVAPTTYSFQSLTHYSAGSFIKITDTVTGVDAVARVISCNMDADRIYSVKAESADYIGMSVDIEDLEFRDFVNQENSIAIEVNKNQVCPNERINAQVYGSIIDTIAVESGENNFLYRWYINGQHRESWDGYTSVNFGYSEFPPGEAALTFKLFYISEDEEIEITEASVVIDVWDPVVAKSLETYWGVSKVPNVTPTSWSLDQVEPSLEFPYLWQYLKYYFTDGSNSVIQPAIVRVWQNSITTIVNHYGKSASKSIEPLSWTTDLNSVELSADEPYLWEYTTYTLADGTVEETVKAVISVYNGDGKIHYVAKYCLGSQSAPYNTGIADSTTEIISNEFVQTQDPAVVPGKRYFVLGKRYVYRAVSEGIPVSGRTYYTATWAYDFSITEDSTPDPLKTYYTIRENFIFNVGDGNVIGDDSGAIGYTYYNVLTDLIAFVPGVVYYERKSTPTYTSVGTPANFTPGVIYYKRLEFDNYQYVDISAFVAGTTYYELEQASIGIELWFDSESEARLAADPDTDYIWRVYGWAAEAGQEPEDWYCEINVATTGEIIDGIFYTVTEGLIPREDGVFDCGITDRAWRTVKAYEASQPSLRRLKKNIHLLEDGFATQELAGIAIYRFLYKREQSDTPEHYGIVIENEKGVRQIVATSDNTGFDADRACGLLIKAFQELEARIRNLEGNNG